MENKKIYQTETKTIIDHQTGEIIQTEHNQKGFVEYVRGQKLHTTLLAKIKIEIVTVEERVSKLVEVIRETTQTGEVGDGKIFVLPVENVIRIRTGEEDGDAI